ncbi:MAG TPA: GNAT family N-acetyltransferase [Thermoanaerobaculia bacterium]|nr:GNAT family N-acetyltransferase [Thermoanaerobaculia bacterium]
MIDVREGTRVDRDAILALRGRCFGGEDPEKQDPRFWEWEFGNGGRFFVAADGDRVVAHLGFVPQLQMLAVDAMTDPDYRRQHLFSRVVECARDTLAVPFSCAFQIREAVLPAMVRGGWKPVARAFVLVRPFVHRGAAGFQPADRQAESLPLHLRWRFVENPLWHYDIHANDDAYVVTRRTKLRGLDSVAIADLGWPKGKERAGRALLREVYAKGRAEGAQVAAVLITLGHPALPVLVRSGFLPSPHRFRFLVNDFGRPLGRKRWALTWADTDHL